jgi:dihydrofolate reductase
MIYYLHMRKIIVFNLVTVDGYFAGPHGEIDWHNYDAEMGEFSKVQMPTFGALMFGEVTYKLMESYWPTPEGQKSEPLVAEIMNTIQKIVFSETMENVEDGPVWKNVKVLHTIQHEEIMALKQQEGKDIGIFGSGTIVQQLTNLGLIDEYRLVVNPLVLGQGKLLFDNIEKRLNLKLVNTKVFRNGNVLLYYQPVKI